MKQLIILLFICRSVSAVAGQSSAVVVDKVIFSSGTYIGGLCQDTLGVDGLSTTNPWASECVKKYIDHKMHDSSTAMHGNVNSKADKSTALTINGETHNLANDRTWTIGVGVTSIGVTSTDLAVSGTPVTSSGSITMNLNTSGVAAGGYGYVTVNTKGIVTAGKRLELYSGSTNSSGVYTVTFGTPYSVAPNIQASITNQSSTNQFIRVSSVSTTGFTVNVFSRSTLTVLGIDLLSAATANVNGATIDALVTEK